MNKNSLAFGNIYNIQRTLSCASYAFSMENNVYPHLVIIPKDSGHGFVNIFLTFLQKTNIRFCWIRKYFSDIFAED